MLFVANIGNTMINIGVFQKDVLVCNARVSSVGNRSADEYAVIMKSILDMNGVDAAAVEKQQRKY